MSKFFLVFFLSFFITTNSIPNKYDSFSFKINENSNILFKRMADGGWKSSESEGEYYVKGASIIKDGQIIDLNKIFHRMNKTKNTDWANEGEIDIQNIHMAINRDNKGIIFSVFDRGKRSERHDFVVTWGLTESETNRINTVIDNEKTFNDRKNTPNTASPNASQVDRDIITDPACGYQIKVNRKIETGQKIKCPSCGHVWLYSAENAESENNH